MIARFRIALLLGVLVGLPGSIDAAELEDVKQVGLPSVETWELKNGLRVAFLPLKSAPSVSVQVWYHAGSKDEAPNRQGSAHMFEHMMFKGSEKLRPEKHAQYLNRVGGRVNAFTTEDATAYQNTVPRAYFDYALELEAERMRNLLFREEMIETEKQVVMEEIRRQANNPVYTGFLRFLQTAFKMHPYAWTAGGRLEHLVDTSVDDLKSFYERYYQPNNALIVIVGNVEREEVEASIARHFGALEKASEAPRPASERLEAPQTTERREVVAPSKLGVVMRGYHIPAAKHPDAAALKVLSLILSRGQSSRLYDALVRNERVAVEAGGQLLLREHPGLLVFFGVYLQAGSAPAVEKSLASVVANAVEKGVSQSEVDKAKSQLASHFVFSLESADGIANQIGSSWIERGDPTNFLEDIRAIFEVERKTVNEVARRYLKANQATVVVIPVDGQQAGGTQKTESK